MSHAESHSEGTAKNKVKSAHFYKDYLAPMFEKEHPSATVKAVGTGKGLIAGPNSSGSNRFAIDSLLERTGFEPSVPP